MAETGRPAEDMTDRELLVDIWEIACSLEARVGELEAKVEAYEDEFLPAARAAKRFGLIGRGRSNGRTHVY